MAADQMKGLMNFAGKSPYGQDGLQPETWMQDEQSGPLNPFKVTTAWQDRSREDQLTMAQARLWETSKRSGKLKTATCGCEAAHPRRPLEVSVDGLAGPLCTVEVEEAGTLRDLREAIHSATGIPPSQQRLVRGAEVLHDDAMTVGDATASRITLLRRPVDQERILEAVGSGGTWRSALASASEAVRGDKEIILKAVSADGSLLRFADGQLQADREVVLAAVRQNRMALRFAAKGLLTDRRFVEAAVQLCGQALEFAPAELRGDADLVQLAAKEDFLALEFADPELLADKNFMLSAVRANAMALIFASPALQKDPDLQQASREQRAALLPPEKEAGNFLRSGAFAKGKKMEPAAELDLASMEGVVDTTTWLMKEVDKICPPIDLPPRHPGMSRAERHQRMLTVQRYLHSQPKECRLLRSEVGNATKLSVEAEQALYEATRRSGLAANAAMQAALSPALAFPPYHGPSFERPADTVSTEHVEEGEPEKGVPVCHLTCHHMGGRWTSDEVTWPWPKDEKASSFLLL
ncbi:Trpt1 [Symbiodinium sp. CCMP2592]|nr:Trpt1 [Symbiodinium sp. CCMP2592]